MARRPVFADLPIGTCFAFDPGAKHATRRKVSERSTMTIPGGKRSMSIYDVEVPVTPTACPTSFGRRKRSNKRSR